MFLAQDLWKGPAEQVAPPGVIAPFTVNHRLCLFPAQLTLRDMPQKCELGFEVNYERFVLASQLEEPENLAEITEHSVARAACLFQRSPLLDLRIGFIKSSALFPPHAIRLKHPTIASKITHAADCFMSSLRYWSVNYPILLIAM